MGHLRDVADQVLLVRGNDEPTADGVELSRIELGSGVVVGSEPHPVGVAWQHFHVQQQVGRGVERHVQLPAEPKDLVGADLFVPRQCVLDVDRPGSPPSRPRTTARSVPCPAPVAAREPNSSTRSRLTRPSRSAARSWSTNRCPARIGPTVWEEEGPIPTEKRSSTDNDIMSIRASHRVASARRGLRMTNGASPARPAHRHATR